MTGTDCVFCQIAAGTAPASIVDEDELTIAFLDTQPINPGHLLVVPKHHAPGLAELPDADAARMFAAGVRLAAALRASDLPCDGLNLFLADGAAAGQEVFHVHLHVFPRTAGDAFRLNYDWSTSPTRSNLDATAGLIREVLQGNALTPA